MKVDERYQRQSALFGEEGQQRIQATRVLVVGLGGLGSHIVQQLAYLGIQAFSVVDDQHVERSNLNRLVGAVEDDVVHGRAKVDVARRVITAVQPQAEVHAIPHQLQSDAGRSAVNSADVVIGCVDNDVARLILTELSCRHAKPYIDLATDTGEDTELWYGGRILFANGGERCLVCMGLLDQRALATAAMSEEQREEEKRIYGVPPASLEDTGPAIISINGVIASLGVTEFIAWRTRLRDPWPYLVYRGDQGRVLLNIDPPSPDCYYCKGLWGSAV